MRRDFDFALLIGILLGFVLACLVIFLPFAGLSDFDRWQTLIAGLVAIVAAAIALWAVRQQILHAQEMENDRRRRQAYAARAMMPHALASLSDYAERCCEELRGLIGDALPPDNQEAVHFHKAFKIPDLPTTSVKPLQQLLQFGENDIQNTIASLMQFLQVQQSRIRIRSIPGTHEVFAQEYYARIAEALEIYVRSGKLFSYSRQRSDEAPKEPTHEDMRSAANNCGFWHAGWDKLKSYIERDWRPYKPM